MLWARAAPARAASALVIGVLVGIAIAILAATDEVAAALVGSLGLVALFGLLRLGGIHRDGWLVEIVTGAYAARLAILAVLHATLVAAGQGGHLLDDEAAFADLAGRLARYVHGEAVSILWVGHEYLFSGFVYAEAAIFAVAGPHVAIVKVLNALAGAILALLVATLAMRLFSRPVGLVAGALAAFQPSLFLWSILNLRDVFGALLGFATVWLLAPGGPALARATLAVAPFAILTDVRGSMAILLGWLAPIGLAVRTDLRRSQRFALAVGAGAIGGLLLMVAGQGFLGATWLHPEGLQHVELRRVYGVAGASTAFAGPAPEAVRRPVLARTGERFLVFDLDAEEQQQARTPGAPPLVQRPSGREVIVGDRTYVALESAVSQPEATPVPERRYEVVRAGDVILIGGPASAPDQPPVLLPLRPGPIDARQVLIQGSPDQARRVIERAALALPRGLLYAVGAPFPVSAHPLERAVGPDMLVWYVALAAATATMWRYRSRWRDLVLLEAYVILTIVVLAVAEGNVGTLFRHRSIVLPFVHVLAAPTLLAVGASLLTRVRGRHPAP